MRQAGAKPHMEEIILPSRTDLEALMELREIESKVATRLPRTSHVLRSIRSQTEKCTLTDNQSANFPGLPQAFPGSPGRPEAPWGS